VDDLADACTILMNLREDVALKSFYSYPKPCFVNVGAGVDLTIAELAYKIKTIINYKGKLVFDPSKPDGMPRKLLDNTKIQLLGWKPKVTFESGIRHTYQWYQSQIAAD
jgi:GDP-L-fucose synthase